MMMRYEYYTYRTKEEAQAYVDRHKIGGDFFALKTLFTLIYAWIKFLKLIFNQKPVVILSCKNVDGYVEAIQKEYFIITFHTHEGDAFIPIARFENLLVRGYGKGDLKALDRISRYLHWVIRKAKPVALISKEIMMIADSLICDIARREKVPTVFIEHGLIANPSINAKALKNNAFYDRFFDAWWFFSEKNRLKSMELLNCRKNENTFVIGVPYIYQMKKNHNYNALSVLIVGDAGVIENDEIMEDYYQDVKHIITVSSHYGFPVKYKKHLKEKVQYLKQILGDSIVFEKDLKRGLSENAIVIGQRTSVLCEAGICGDYVIQFRNKAREIDEYVYSNVYLIDEVEKELGNVFEKIIRREILPKPVDEKDCFIPDDRLKRFNQGIKMLYNIM